MNRKEELHYEMLNLMYLLLKYLMCEFTDVTYLELNDGLVSVQNALRKYFMEGEETNETKKS